MHISQKSPIPTSGSASRNVGSSAPTFINLASGPEDDAAPAADVVAANERAKSKVDCDVRPKSEGYLPGWVLDMSDPDWDDVERAEGALDMLDEMSRKPLIEYMQNFFAQAVDSIAEFQRLGRKPEGQVWRRALNIAERHLQSKHAELAAAARSFYGAYFKSKSFALKRVGQR